MDDNWCHMDNLNTYIQLLITICHWQEVENIDKQRRQVFFGFAPILPGQVIVKLKNI